MNKQEFLKELEFELKSSNVSYLEGADIISDYEQLITEAIESGKDEEEYINNLGKPEDIVEGLNKEVGLLENNFLNFEINFNGKNQTGLLARVFPLLTVIVFYFLGVTYSLWHPAWIVMWLIPAFYKTNESESFFSKFVFFGLVLGISGYLYGYYHNYISDVWLLVLLTIPGFLLFNRNTVGALSAICYLLSGVASYYYSNPIIFTCAIAVLALYHVLRKDGLFSETGFAITSFVFLGVGFGVWKYAWLTILVVPILKSIDDYYRKKH